MTPEDVALAMRNELEPRAGTDHPDEGAPPVPVGAGGAIAPPPPLGAEDPGQNPAFGPNFVRFTIGRFAAVEQGLARLIDVLSRRPQEGWRFVTDGNTDGSGNVTIKVFDASPNQKFALHRLYIHAEGKTWASPYTGAGEILILVNGVPWDGASLVANSGQLPAVFTASRLAAVEAQDGETLSVKIVGGPASTRIECRCQGVLSTVHGDDR